jgi:hypothetical protein
MSPGGDHRRNGIGTEIYEAEPPLANLKSGYLKGKISNIPLKLVLFPDLPSLSRNNSRFVAFLIQSKEMIKS